MSRMTIPGAGKIKPRGWLRRQLEIQAQGLSGNLDKIWPDVRDSAWIGGDREGWERVPYWLDGFIPLAFLLEDEALIKRAKKYIDAILSSQRESGWLCPCNDEKIKEYDLWAVLLISKVLTVYYECTGDEKVLNALYRAMKNFYDLLSSRKVRLFGWGKYRWFEGFIALGLLNEKYDEDWIEKLAALLKKQGANYEKYARLWKNPKNKWRFDTHIVNLSMMLKEEAVTGPLLGDYAKGKAERLFRILDEYNGTPVGIFTGDECLSGLSPIQGTELCAVAEIMYSYELLYAYTGDARWAERLELAAFNAFPATVSDDMRTHQYDQMSNQIACEKLGDKPIFRTNSGEAHLFGLEPNYGCCTANFNQAFPKLALSAFMYDDTSVLSAVFLPCELVLDGIHISLETEYPFKNEMHYHITADKAFTFKVRIPSFASELSVNGENEKNSGLLTFDIEKDAKKDIRLSFETKAKIVDRPNDLKAVRCGSLVFSLPVRYKKRVLEYTKDGVERKIPYCDYEYIPEGQWQYGLCNIEEKAKYNGVGDFPFSSDEPPVTLEATVRRIDWGFESGYTSVCAKIPHSTLPLGDEEKITLYPYGCAKLRVTELPYL